MQFIVDHEERLDRYLATVMPEHSRSKLVKWIDAGEVSVNGGATKPSLLLKLGDVVELRALEESAPHDLTPFEMPLEVLFEDDEMMVINKPRGLATHPAASLKEPSLVNVLLGRNTHLSSVGESFRPGIVHRLDKDTTGLLLVAKSDRAHVTLARHIEEKLTERRYFAVVRGSMEQERFRVDAPMGRDTTNRLRMAVTANGKPALTHGRTVMRLDRGSVVALRLETGRTHQIRVHMQAVGHPVLGDPLYGHREDQDVPLQLHAAYIAVTHPVTQERLTFFVAPDASFSGAEWATEEAITAWERP
ncbi:MAG: RluA family pseudouridine synthase [Fimbriimonas sp.]